MKASQYKWLVSAVLFGCLLRLWMLGHQSLWVDETGTWINVLFSGTSITHFAFHSNNAPPLYFWTLYPLLQLFGQSEAALRILSAGCGGATIPVFWLLARRIARSQRVADLAAILLALNPLHLWFSQEARPYAFFMLLFIASCLLFLRAMDRSEKFWRWVVLTVVLVLTALTHTLSVILLPLFAGWFFLFNPTRQKCIRCALTGTVFAGIAFPIAIYISRITEVAPLARRFSGLEIPYTFFTFLAGYSFGPPIRSLQLIGFKEAVLAYGVQTGLIVLILLLIGWLAIRRFSREQLPVYVWMAIPLLVAVAIALGTPHSYNVRFALPALPAFLLLIAFLLEKTRPKAAVLFGGLIVLIFLWADIQWFLVPAYGKEDSRAAVQVLLQNRPEIKRVAIAPSYAVDTVMYYLKKAGSHAQGVPVEIPAEALLITRRQHVPLAGELKKQFVKNHAGQSLGFFSETGYEIILVLGDPAQ